MKYKVGDNVFIKGEVVGTDEGAKLDVKIKLDSGETEWYESEEVKPYVDKTYEDGLQDAWELARKLVVDFRDMSGETFVNIFGGYLFEVFTFTPQEVLAKLKAYEESKEIKVGDVIKLDDDVVVVTKVVKGTPNTMIYGLEDNGCAICYSSKEFEKIGKHIDIAGLLEQIKGE